MAQITYRANLSSTSFPFVSENFGRSVIIPQYDQNFNRQLQLTAEERDKDIGIPQLYYCHNVMPFAPGIQSVAYKNVIAKIGGTFLGILETFLIRDGAGNRVYVSYDGTFTWRYYNMSISTWSVMGTTTPAAGGSGTVTHAYVNGVTYVYLEKYGCMTYDFVSNTFVGVTLTGLDINKVRGITAAAGYLIAWGFGSTTFIPANTVSITAGSPIVIGPAPVDIDKIVVGQQVSGTGIPIGAKVLSIQPGSGFTLNVAATVTNASVAIKFYATNDIVAWSSTIDATDFVPSTITGAGGGSVEGARGSITTVLPHILGFIVYTTNNAVAALYSGNALYPFNFREIVSSGGVLSAQTISWDTNTGNHYAYTTSGLQLISTTQAQTIFPELTDFLSGLYFEDFNESSNTFTTTTLSAVMQKKLTVIADRYIVFSYGTLSLTHALVYDLAMKRWGKLKIPHIDCFEYELPDVSIVETPKRSIAFLNTNGAVDVVDFASSNTPTTSGVAILGKYQFVRPRTLQLNEINVENIPAGATFSLNILSSADGKNNTLTTPVLMDSVGLYRRYGCRAVGLNHALIMKGKFQLVSLVLNMNIHGKR